MSQTIEIRKDILIKQKDHACRNRSDFAKRAVILFVESCITVSQRAENKINCPKKKKKTSYKVGKCRKMPDKMITI